MVWNNASADFTAMIRFKSNPRKALEVVLWFADRRPGIDFHAILKLLFFAEKRHLNEWGRPIVGGNYNALPYGPVAQTTYDLLKREPLILEVLQLDDGPPFTVEGGYRVHGDRTPNFDKLSKSDIDALDAVWNEYGDLSFNELKELSHADPAYKRAEDAGRQQMLYEDFLEGDNVSEEKITDLNECAHRLRI